LPVRAGTLDLGFLSMVYHHFPEPAEVVAELRRTLRSGGPAVLRTVTLGTLDG
jgi:SAM-dependent methyltransferase